MEVYCFLEKKVLVSSDADCADCQFVSTCFDKINTEEATDFEFTFSEDEDWDDDSDLED